MLKGARPDIQAAWLRGDYSAAVTGLEAQPPGLERNFALARVYLRRGRHDAAAALLRASRPLFASDAAKSTALSFESIAEAACGRVPEARAALALALERPVSDPSARAEVAYNHAAVLWMLGDAEASAAIVEAYLAGMQGEIDIPIKAQFLMLRGWLFAARERYVDQANALIEAISCLLAAPEHDVGLLAWSVYPLAAIARDVHVPAAADLLLRLERELPWTADLQREHFQTVRAVAWMQVLYGDYVSAFRKFDAAAALAPQDLAKALLHLDRAECARFSGYAHVVDAALADAREVLDTFDWSTAVWEESRALIAAAEAFGPRDRALAAKYLRIARGLRPQMAKNAGYAHDRRLGAHADFAEAVIEEFKGAPRVAAARAKDAYDVFNAIGYRWRAAQCALFLHRLDDGGDWLERAAEAIAPYQRSFIAEEVRKATPAVNPLERLTARQREIVDLLCDGEKITDIADALRLSPNTVRVHITKIHRTLNVQRRSQLLIEVARLSAA